MTDGTKTSLSCVSAISMLFLPVVALGIGWIGWDLRMGLIAALGTFAAFFLLSGVLIGTVREPSRIVALLPILFGALYTLLPDFIPGPIDDSAAFAGGAMLSFSLWMRRNPDTPRWLVFPLLTASLYTLVGGLIPGPVDELLVYAILGGVSAARAYQQLETSQTAPQALPTVSGTESSKADVVDGEYKIE